VRNIRAYRERGLLDPPRRSGRAALYDDYHLSQLNTISQLLNKGYNSAHIAEFFASMRQGTDLADILGLQRAVLGPHPPDSGARPPSNGEVEITLSPQAEEAEKLVAYGMAEIVSGKLTMTDPGAAEILARAPDELLYVQALVKFLDAAEESVDVVAEAFVTSLVELFHAWVGPGYLPRPDEMEEIRQVVEDYRTLGETVIAARFDQVARRYMVASASDYTAGILLTGAWDPRRHA
ncbi:MAG: MerR family transcriptional regulator, partial [Actinomycetota bacterium]|nr:MerR family transcriptional regulator [Actinomycetota bacterium]